jgi:hypothetical protein
VIDINGYPRAALPGLTRQFMGSPRKWMRIMDARVKPAREELCHNL